MNGKMHVTTSVDSLDASQARLQRIQLLASDNENVIAITPSDVPFILAHHLSVALSLHAVMLCAPLKYLSVNSRECRSLHTLPRDVSPKVVLKLEASAISFSPSN